MPEGLRLKPAKVLVDGNRLPVLDVLAEAIVKGDVTVPAISAASIPPKSPATAGAPELTPSTRNTARWSQGLRYRAHCRAAEAWRLPRHRKTFSPVTQVCPGVCLTLPMADLSHYLPRQPAAWELRSRPDNTAHRKVASGRATICAVLPRNAAEAWAAVFRVFLANPKSSPSLVEYARAAIKT